MAALRSVAVVGARACTAYGERATAAVAGGLAQDGWAVVSGGAFGIDAARTSCGAGRRRPDGCRPRLRGRRRLPPGPRRPALPDRRLGAGRLRAAPGQPAPQAPVPRPQPGDRGAEPGHGRRGGRPAQRCDGHRLPSAARSAGWSWPCPVRSPRWPAPGPTACFTSRLPGPSVTAPRSPRCSPSPVPPAGTRAHRPAPRGGTAPAALAGLTDEARAVLGALPGRGTRTVEAAAERAGISPAACLAHLGLLEIVGLARRAGPGWRRCA